LANGKERKKLGVFLNQILGSFETMQSHQRIAVEGIRIYAHHGCLPEERIIGSEYRVDVYVETHFMEAAATDDLSHTLDYVTIRNLVVKEMEQPANLIEQVIWRIENRLYAAFPNRILKSRIRLTKLNPPMNGQVEQVWVELER
jgi:dihydroneopterin aldolase